MNQTNCLQQDDIAGYILGSADDDKIEDIGNHLADCPRCQAVADELDSSVSDPLTDALHGPEPDDDFSSEQECQQALSRAKKLIDTQPPSSSTSNNRAIDEQLSANQHLGEYVILERLGGHMGAVYKARQTALDRFVAVKVLPEKVLRDEQAIARFQSEMKAVGRLEHPHIVRAYDAREIDGKQVLVMEFVEGENLSELLRTRGRLLVADACEIIRQAAVGLQCVHEKGLVHRDVKPSNLMMTPQGEIKILDLGLAHFHAGQPGTGETTSTGNIVGTPVYMAPEQVTGSKDVDIRADVYGLGCTLYKLLSNRAPYEDLKDKSTSSILAAHVCKSIPSIKKSQPDVPDALVAVLNRMLAKTPSDRFETPGQVATALEPFTSGCDLRALKEGDESRRRSIKKHRLPDPQPSQPSSGLWKLMATAAVLILLILGGKWGYDYLDRFRNVPDPNPGQLAEEQQEQTPDGSSTSVDDPGSGLAGLDHPPNAAPKPVPSKPKPPAGLGGATQASDGLRDGLEGLGNPVAKFTVRVYVDHPNRTYRGAPAGPDGRGELMRVKVTSEKKGYLYLIYRSADGKLSMIFPNRVQKSNEISANEEIDVPHPNADFQLRVGPPYGEEQLQAVVSLVPRQPDFFGVESLTDADAAPLQPANVKSVFVELKKEPANWADCLVQITTRPGEQQERAQEDQRQDAGTADETDISSTDPATPSSNVASDEVSVITSGETLENVLDEAPEEVPTERPVEIIDGEPEDVPTESPVEIIDESPEETLAARPVEMIDEEPDETIEEEPDWLDSPNVHQTFDVRVEVDHPDRTYRGAPAGPDGRGELMRVKVTSEKEGYLYLIYKSADGKLSMVFPNKIQKDNRISANEEIDVPHPNANFQLRVCPPYGRELLKAIVSLVPREPKDFGVKSLTDADATPLQPNNVKSVFVELKKEPKGWAEGHVEVTTKPEGQSDESRRTLPTSGSTGVEALARRGGEL